MFASYDQDLVFKAIQWSLMLPGGCLSRSNTATHHLLLPSMDKPMLKKFWKVLVRRFVQQLWVNVITPETRKPTWWGICSRWIPRKLFCSGSTATSCKRQHRGSQKATKDIEDGFRDGQLEKLHPPQLKDHPTIRKAKEQPTYQTKIVNGEVVPVVNKEEIFWQAPIPLSQHTLPTINLDLLPSWLGDFTKSLSQFTETPPELPLAMVLAACSTAAARRFKIRIKSNYSEPTNLWLICALAPGNRKSFVQKEASQPLLDWEQAKAEELKSVIQQAQSERKTQEGIKEQQQELPRQQK